MTKPTTTIVIILLAGDADTVEILDSLLAEFHFGLNSTTDRTPDIYCMYYRRNSESTPIPSAWFKLLANTLTFINERTLDTFPPAGANDLTGTLPHQVRAFIDGLNSGGLSPAGPIRVVVGAHGLASLGINPTMNLLRHLWRRIRNHFRRPLSNSAPPSSLTSRNGVHIPDVLLDQLADALCRLPKGRVKSLILHTCNLSGVETIHALNEIPHHIACESRLSDHLRFRDWFTTLTDPNATPSQITQSCFNSISSAPQSASGCFSSYTTACQSQLLAALNALGIHLKSLLDGTASRRRDAIAAIKLAQDASSDSHAVDLSYFCDLLLNPAYALLFEPSVLLAVKAALGNLSLQTVKTNLNTEPRFSNFLGISVFFPASNDHTYSVSNLPNSFQSAAQGWCSFLRAWSAIP